MIKVIHYGLGEIGAGAARLVLARKGMKIVGAVDIDPKKAGKDIGGIIGAGKPLGVKVSGDAERLLSKTKADVVIHTTGSQLCRVFSQIEEVLSYGINLVSSAEELSFPYFKNAALAGKIDKLARKSGVSVLGTGVNPGFVMDYLPLCLTGVCREVKSVRVERVVDAGRRRFPLQRKIGAGRGEREFRKMVKEKKLGHAGLVESAAMIAKGLGWGIDSIKETVVPEIAGRNYKTRYLRVSRGQVSGLRHTASARRGGKTLIRLELRMSVGAKKPYDSIYIKGSPDINLKIDGGIAGDEATEAMLVNSVEPLVSSPPGLITMDKLLGLSYRR